MPTIFIKNGFRFFFYSADSKEPIHVHVEYGGGTAKFWLHPLRLVHDEGLKTPELKQAGFLIVENIELIEERWNEYFGK